eukprot:TRINITY_DN64592_c0_g1_i1.p1 TRINITY_DN64592_c0_g1~~TRINITY_DN64592_c0_g1_i1.p1  ORF type:complete len:728 (-),score=131.21 TRINITY_DN64592_c0_g1_i1:234-2417(-)
MSPAYARGRSSLEMALDASITSLMVSVETPNERPPARLSAIASTFVSSESARTMAGRLVEPVIGSSLQPACRSCGRGWRIPRNLPFINLVDDVPRDLLPTTKEAVIAHLTTVPEDPKFGGQNVESITSKVFEVLQLTANAVSLKNKLVTEFKYHKETGEVHYEIDSSQCRSESYGYARLISLNSWYIDLFYTLMGVIFSVMDLQSNLLTMALLAQTSEDPREVLTFYVFSGCYVGMIVVSVLFAIRYSSRDWRIHSQHRVGDLIKKAHWFDQTLAFLGLVLCNFFAVPQSVRDVVVTLHPWKSVQPFAAIKLEGTRMFTVGHKDEVMFRVGEYPGQHFLMPLQLSMRSFVFAFKVWLCTRNFQPMIVVSCISSTLGIVWGSYVWFLLMKARLELKSTLLRVIQDYMPVDGVSDEFGKRQSEAAKKLLKLHFNIESTSEPAPVTPIVEKEPMGASGSSDHIECSQCGRSHPLSIQLVSFEQGDKVSLKSGYEHFFDAGRGPLAPGDVGEVVLLGPEVRGLYPRVLVEMQGKTWWYDSGCLTLSKSSSIDDLDGIVMTALDKAAGEVLEDPKASAACTAECGRGADVGTSAPLIGGGGGGAVGGSVDAGAGASGCAAADDGVDADVDADCACARKGGGATAKPMRAAENLGASASEMRGLHFPSSRSGSVTLRPDGAAGAAAGAGARERPSWLLCNHCGDRDSSTRAEIGVNAISAPVGLAFDTPVADS